MVKGQSHVYDDNWFARLVYWIVASYVRDPMHTLNVDAPAGWDFI